MPVQAQLKIAFHGQRDIIGIVFGRNGARHDGRSAVLLSLHGCNRRERYRRLDGSHHITGDGDVIDIQARACRLLELETDVPGHIQVICVLLPGPIEGASVQRGPGAAAVGAILNLQRSIGITAVF